MITRYNIALIPSAKKSDFINFAEYLKNIAGSYKIGPDSIPHVTLCQFNAKSDDLEGIWHKVNMVINQKSINLKFDDISCIEMDGSNWISLLPDNLDSLKDMHCTIANVIENRVGRCFEKFDAHLTIINTSAGNYKERAFSIPYIPIEDEFILALGKSDDIGQLQKYDLARTLDV